MKFEMNLLNHIEVSLFVRFCFFRIINKPTESVKIVRFGKIYFIVFTIH